MITFGSPWAFLLLIPALLLPLQPRVTGVLRLVVPGPEVHASRWTLRRAIAWVPTALQVVALSLLVVALARPQLTRKDVIVTSDGLDIMLAVDTSGSMRAEDFTSGITPVNRLEIAKAVIAEFVKARPYDRIGVVAFGSEAFTHVPLTLDHDTLLAVLDEVRIGIAGEGSTAIGTAIAVGSKRLKDLDAPSKLLIVLTDGRSNAGRLSPLEAADLAATLGIKVYTIGVGADRRIGPFSIQADGVDEETLQAVADVTKGRFFRAGDTKTLQQVYQTIDQLEPSPAEVEQLVEHEELFRRFLVPGAILLVVQMLASATWLRRFP